jgi:hypothetical protein
MHKRSILKNDAGVAPVTALPRGGEQPPQYQPAVLKTDFCDIFGNILAKFREMWYDINDR